MNGHEWSDISTFVPVKSDKCCHAGITVHWRRAEPWQVDRLTMQWWSTHSLQLQWVTLLQVLHALQHGHCAEPSVGQVSHGGSGTPTTRHTRHMTLQCSLECSPELGGQCIVEDGIDSTRKCKYYDLFKNYYVELVFRELQRDYYGYPD